MKITEKRTHAVLECAKKGRRHTTMLKRCWGLNDTQTVREYLGDPRGDKTDDTGTYQVEWY